MIRSIRFFFQRLIRGWDDSDTWSLDFTISKFVLPRLKRYKEITIVDWEHHNSEAGCDILEELIWMHEMIVADEEIHWMTGEVLERFERASQLWGKYYRGLWW